MNKILTPIGIALALLTIVIIIAILFYDIEKEEPLPANEPSYHLPDANDIGTSETDGR